MDEGSESNIWQRLKRIVRGNVETVEQAIDEASKEGELDQTERSMLLNVLQLDDLQVQDVMTPRTDIVCASHTSTVNEIIALIISSGHSRIPLYEESRDDLIGVIHAKDLLPFFVNPEHLHYPAKQYMRPISFIPETKNVMDLLHEFQMQKSHMAGVLDEFGGVTGLVTIEDLLEEIVGEIEDEHDTPKQADITSKADGSFHISGRAHLEDVSEQLHVTISAEEVDTIGGYLSLLAGHVPKNDETFTIGKYQIIVLDADAKQVYTLRAVPLTSITGTASDTLLPQKN